NQTYFGYDSDNATFTDAFDLDGNNPAVYGFFDFSFDGTKDVDGNNLADDLGDHTGILNYSSIINLSISDPRDIAAARDLGGGQFAQGDGSNIEAVIALQNDTNSFSLGDFGFTGRVEDIFTDVVSFVGNAKATSKASLDIAETNHTIAANQRDQISSVNIDEEFTDMIQFQKAFEAAARLIRVASDLLDQIVNVI
ncbi:MAG: hypothetical protein H6619_06070, partial [Deltaproteobacteria bacterium]|nr:hypothetical protein [Deltaproteobacteria bacterium]